MGIRLVYGLQTADLSYLDIFYPSRRLKEAARTSKLDYAAMIHRPSDSPARVLDFCTDAEGGHTALLRGELPDTLYAYLEAEGISVVNPAKAVALARDKLASANFFDALGVRHPLTIPARQGQAPLSAAHSISLPLTRAEADSPPLPLPFVAKPRYGKMGRGVVRIDSEEQWAEYQTAAASQGWEILGQEFVEAAEGKDVRFFFADFTVLSEQLAQRDTGSGAWFSLGLSEAEGGGLAWVCVTRSSEGFVSNAHAGGKMDIFIPPEALQLEAQRIFARSGLVYGTVDFLFANKAGTDFVVCEMNANPGFEELERVTGLDIAAAILASARSADSGAVNPVRRARS